MSKSPEPAVVNADFRTPVGLASGHLQSVRNRVRPRSYDLSSLSTAHSLLVPLSDGTGDRLVVMLHRLRPRPHWAPGGGPRRGVVLLVHGLGGSAESVYMRATTFGLLAAGFHVARVDLRSAGESKWWSLQSYHAGKTEDLRDVLRVLATRPEAVDSATGRAQLRVMGFSLGGAMTLKLLGEPYDDLPIAGGVAVSAPLDLLVGSPHLRNSAFGIYERAIMRAVRRDAMAPAPRGRRRLTEAERDAVAKVRSLREFDDVLTAPRHGWRDSAEYYQVNSAAPYLAHIQAATLVIHALDDPLIAPEPYLTVDWEALAQRGFVHRAITARGGHVGFHERGRPMPWYVPRAVEFMSRTIGPAPGDQHSDGRC